MPRRNLEEAMILGAGMGTRMEDLTRNQAKPMLPFGEKTLFDLTLEYLTHFGVKRFAVNTHHCRKSFESFVNSRKSKYDITVFSEEDEILGTGGGIYNMRSFPRNEDFLILNCDFLAGIDLKKVFSFHQDEKAHATLVLVQPKGAENYAGVELEKGNRIRGFSEPGKSLAGKEHWVFSGIHILRKELFKNAPAQKKFCVIQDWYIPALRAGRRVLGFQTQEPWIDLGEKELYEKERASFEEAPYTWIKKI